MFHRLLVVCYCPPILCAGAGRTHEDTSGTVVAQHRVGDRGRLQGDGDQVALRLLDRLAHRFRNLLRLALAEPDAAVSVTHHHQGGEAEAPATLDHLGAAVDGDDRLGQLSFLHSALDLSCHHDSFACAMSDPNLDVDRRTPRPNPTGRSELQSRLPCGVGQGSPLGILVLPTTLIVGPDGKLAFIEDLYSRNFYAQTKAYVRFLLGEITPDQLKAELDPGKSAEVSPTRIKAERYVNMALVLLELKEKAKAREALKTAVEADPSFQEPHLLLARICLEDNEVSEAGTELEQALKLNPSPKEGKLLQGLTYASQGEDGLAVAVLQELVQNNPQPPPEAYYQIGKICEKQKKTSEAVAAYQAALELLLAR